MLKPYPNLQDTLLTNQLESLQHIPTQILMSFHQIDHLRVLIDQEVSKINPLMF